MNDDNLKKGEAFRFKKGDAAARAAGSKGGMATQRNRTFREEAMVKLYEKAGAKAVVEAMFEMATSGASGAVQAATWLRDTVGEKPVDESKVEASGGITFYFEGGTGEDISG